MTDIVNINDLNIEGIVETLFLNLEKYRFSLFRKTRLLKSINKYVENSPIKILFKWTSQSNISGGSFSSQDKRITIHLFPDYFSKHDDIEIKRLIRRTLYHEWRHYYQLISVGSSSNMIKYYTKNSSLNLKKNSKIVEQFSNSRLINHHTQFIGYFNNHFEIDAYAFETAKTGYSCLLDKNFLKYISDKNKKKLNKKIYLMRKK